MGLIISTQLWFAKATRSWQWIINCGLYVGPYYENRTQGTQKCN